MEALRDDLRLALDRVAFAHKAFRFLPYGDRPDGWQEELLRSTSKRIILNCARQSGKTTAVAALALHTAIYRPRSFCLIYAPSQDQSTEFFKRVEELAHGLGMDAVNPEALRKTGMDLDLLPKTWSSYYESPTAPDGRKEDSLWANDTYRSRSCASSARRRQS
jgi:hypothetical protein